MNLRRFFSKSTVTNLSRLNRGYRSFAATTTSSAPIFHGGAYHASSFSNSPKSPKLDKPYVRYVHSLQQVNLDDSEPELENDDTMNEFLSRFVWIMRKKLCEAYPDCDKNTVDGMLVIIVGKVVQEIEKGGLEHMTGGAASSMPPGDFSEDLWRTVWEVSNVVLQDMEKEKKKEKMKSFLQSEEVKEMYRFAGEVGIRGDMLRELRFKWAREKMEESEFYQSLVRLRKEEAQEESKEKEQLRKEIADGEYDGNVGEDKEKIGPIPKRQGKIKYKIYGLDLSEPKWAEVADKVHESNEVLWPQEAKPISGKCKLVMAKILSLKDEDDPAPLLGEWIELLEPSRIDWISFLDRLKEENPPLYFKISELALGQDSFQANIHDYSKLIDSLSKENRLEDAERILNKMKENGILPDIVTSTVVVHMYCKSGNLERAKEAFETLRKNGFQPNLKVYNSMIMAYVKSDQPKDGESLLREMETRDIKPTEEIFMALLRSFARSGDTAAAERISNTMQFTGIQQSRESSSLMIEACAKAGNPEEARSNFDAMMNLGHEPDDRCMASVIMAYQKKNSLDDALNLLLELEKNGFVPGVLTYTVLVDWMSKLELFDEAEQLLDKIAEIGEAPPYKLHISLCDMYVKAGNEKKALQALGVVEKKIDELEVEEFERIICSLWDGGFQQDAKRIQSLMEKRGFKLSDQLRMYEIGGKSNKSNRFSLMRQR